MLDGHRKRSIPFGITQCRVGAGLEEYPTYLAMPLFDSQSECGPAAVIRGIDVSSTLKLEQRGVLGAMHDSHPEKWRQ